MISFCKLRSPSSFLPSRFHSNPRALTRRESNVERRVIKFALSTTTGDYFRAQSSSRVCECHPANDQAEERQGGEVIKKTGGGVMSYKGEKWRQDE